ncbi:hypothetical protein ACFLZ6_00925 [Nanoarchaeota archaeon]
MAKSKPKVKRAISKPKKTSRAGKKLPKLVIPEAPSRKPKIKPVKIKLSSKSKSMDILPPPPPEFYKKGTVEIKGFTPSPHEISRIVVQLKKDINYIVSNRKFLHMSNDKLENFPTAGIVRLLDTLKDEDKYVKGLKDVESKVNSYEKIPKKGWFSARKIKEARNFLEAYKLVADETRKDLIEKLESVRKKREIDERKQKAEGDFAKKEKIIESLEKKPEIKPIKVEKSKLKEKKLDVEKPKFSLFGRTKPKKIEPAKEKAKVPEFEPDLEPEEHKEIKNHVSQLKKSIKHVRKHESLLSKVEKKLHKLSHKELHGTLGKLKATKEHLGKIEDVEEHVAAHASVPKKAAHPKIKKAKDLLDKHKIDTVKVKKAVEEKIGSVKKRIHVVEKEHKEATEKKEKLEKETADLVPKIYRLRKHLRFVSGNEKLLKLPDEEITALSPRKLNKLSFKLKVLKEYLSEIEKIEEHFVAESSKPDTLTADKHLERARKLIDDYEIDAAKEKPLLAEKIALVNKQLKKAPICAPTKVPKFEAAPKPEDKDEKPEAETEEKPKELDVPVPKFGKPKPELLDLMSRLKKTLAYASKYSDILQVPDNKLKSLSSWRLNRTIKKLNALNQNLTELEDVEEHIAAQSSKPQDLSSEKLLEDARNMMDSAKIDVRKNLKSVDAKLKFVHAPPIPEFKPVPKTEEAVEEPEVEEKPEPVKIEQPAVGEAPPKFELMPKVGVPSKELAMQMYRLDKALGFASKNEKVLQLSDEVLRSVSSWRLRGISKKLSALKKYLAQAEDIEEHIAAESSTVKNERIEKQLEKAKEIMDSHAINIAKMLKSVDDRIAFVQSMKPGMVQEMPEVPKAEVPKLDVPKLDIKEEVPKPESEAKDIGKPKPELSKLTSKIRDAVSILNKNKQFVAMPDDSLASLSPRKLTKIAKRMALFKQSLIDLEDVDEEIAAQSSVEQCLAVEKQLDTLRKLKILANIDLDDSKKQVDSKLDFIEEHLDSQPKYKRRYEVLMQKFGKVPDEPVIEKAKVPEMPKLPESKGELPPLPKGVPIFKPSATELYMLISRLKRDLSFITKHEKLLHAPDEKLLALSHGNYESILEDLKTEQEYLDDLELAEKSVESYERIPKKGWLTARKIAGARKLLDVYNSIDVSMTRKMVVSRLKLMQERKGMAESERVKMAGKALAERKLKATGEAEALKHVETHVIEHEKKTAEERLADMKSTKLLKLAEEEKMKRLKVPEHKVISVKPPVYEKPILDRERYEAQKEITEAIGAIKTEAPDIRNKIEYIMQRIDEARKALEDLDVHTAKSIYIDVHNIYTTMKPLEQYRVYEALSDLYNERKQAEQLVS